LEILPFQKIYSPLPGLLNHFQNCIDTHLGQFNIFCFGQAVDADRPDDGVIQNDRQAAAPAQDFWVAIIGDIETLLRVAGGLTNVTRGFTLTRRGVGFIRCNLDRGEWCAIHAQ
jgi:hypothetical protein